MMELFNSQNWLNIWGGIILIGLPLLFAFATMIYRRSMSMTEQEYMFYHIPYRNLSH